MTCKSLTLDNLEES